MEPSGPEPPRYCATCSNWEWDGQGAEPLLRKCNHPFWSCEQDSRFRCYYFEQRKPHAAHPTTPLPPNGSSRERENYIDSDFRESGD